MPEIQKPFIGSPLFVLLEHLLLAVQKFHLCEIRGLYRQSASYGSGIKIIGVELNIINLVLSKCYCSSLLVKRARQ